MLIFVHYFNETHKMPFIYRKIHDKNVDCTFVYVTNGNNIVKPMMQLA